MTGTHNCIETAECSNNDDGFTCTITISNGKFETILAGTSNFDTAYAYCDARGYRLPVPQNENQNSLFSEIVGSNFWLCITDLYNSIWTNIYSNNEITFTQWNADELSDGDGEDYAYSGLSTKWRDVIKNENFPILCVRPLCSTGLEANAEFSGFDNIDECALETDGITQICFNTFGGFACDCEGGTES